MPADDSPAILVARFLRTNDYHEVQFPYPTFNSSVFTN